ARPDGGRHDCSEITGRGEGPLATTGHDGTRDAAREALLAERRHDFRQLALIDLCEPLRGGDAASGIHAHVEGTVVREAEAARRIVELWRGDAEIEEGAVETATRLDRH